MKAYSYFMGVLNGSDMWPKIDLTPLIPPTFENLLGRPKKQSRKQGACEGKIF